MSAWKGFKFMAEVGLELLFDDLSGGVSVLFGKNRWQKCGKFHVHQEKNNFSGKATQNGNIGGIEPKIWVCIEFVSISRTH